MTTTLTNPSQTYHPRLHLGTVTKKKLPRWPLAKDILLIFRSANTWDRIATEQRSVGFTFFIYFLPMLVLAALAEGCGLWLIGQQPIVHGPTSRFTATHIVGYETAEMILTILLILVCASFIKMFGNTCIRRNYFSQSFTVMMHAVGPMLLVQLLNGFPSMNPWLTWFTGIILTLGALYHGLPRVMLPDAPSALGLYLGSTFVVFTLFLAGRFFTYWYLIGQFNSLQHFLSGSSKIL